MFFITMYVYQMCSQISVKMEKIGKQTADWNKYIFFYLFEAKLWSHLAQVNGSPSLDWISTKFVHTWLCKVFSENKTKNVNK